MITEDYVSFETAKLLKEKGFDAQCRAAYTNYGQLFTTQINQYVTNIVCSKGYLWECIAPTLQMVIKWLREEHNLQIIFIPVRTKQHKNWTFEIYKEFIPLYTDVSCFSTYEEVCEAAIKYCLENLI